jgi:pentatricopeptide repeat protein
MILGVQGTEPISASPLLNARGDGLIRTFSSIGTLLESSLSFVKILDPCAIAWHSIIAAHSAHGYGHRAVALFQAMCAEGFVHPNRFLFPTLLKTCASIGAVGYGKALHGCITQFGCESEVVIGSSLVDMYVKFDRLVEARKVFDSLPDKNKNAVSWTAIIDGYVHHNRGLSALRLFERMCREGTAPDKVVFLCIVKACASVGALAEGMLVHDRITRAESDLDVALSNTLVDMYAKCGHLAGAHSLFDKLVDRNVVTWGAMITGYAQNEQGEPALELYDQMEREGVEPNQIILPCLLKACANLKRLEQGRRIHRKMLEGRKAEFDVVVGSTLVDMYAKCGSLEEAYQVFEDLPVRNVVSWSAIIGGCIEQGHGLLGMELFVKMQDEGVKPDKIVFVCMLRACGSMGTIEQGMLVHSQIIESIDIDIVVQGALTDMYAKCGSREDARDSLVKSPDENVVLWGALIAGYAQYGDWKLTHQCLEDMEKESVDANSTIYTSILSACRHAGEVDEACKSFKSMAVNQSMNPELEHFICMIDLLGSTGQLKEASNLLQCVPTVLTTITGWTALLTACRTYGNVTLGRECFGQVSMLDF